ncbi:MAG: metal ABC transporter solute-binding protein, Zn/Mn family [Mangrovibacterium sp.]
MKRVILFFLVMITFGCTTKPVTDKMIISVTILPQKYFVEKIAGDLVQVHVLVPPGASPELYSLMPSQMKELSRSAAWMRIGKIGFEEGWIDKIRQSTPRLKIFDTSVHADWIAGEEEHGEHVHLHGIDPHIWSAPDEVRNIVTETYQALSILLPANKEILKRNYESFMQEIDQLDQDLKDQFVQLKNRKFLIFHPALTYFARRYNLEQIALEVDGKEPSPRYMRSLIEKAKSENIRVILIQKEFDAENARQLAKEIGGEVVQIDPLNEQWDKQLREIAKKIIAASEK